MNRELLWRQNMNNESIREGERMRGRETRDKRDGGEGKKRKEYRLTGLRGKVNVEKGGERSEY